MKETMQNLAQLLSRKDSLLTKAQWQVIEEEMVTSARPVLQARRVFAGATKVLNDPGRIEVLWYEQTGMGSAIISLLGEDGPSTDRVDHTEKTLQLPVLQKDWELPWRILEASKARPTALGALDVENAAEAAYQVALLEEEFVATGKGKHKGLLNASSIQTTGGSTWGADTDASWEARHNDILTAIGKLQDKDFYGVNGRYQCIVNPAEYRKMKRIRANGLGRSVISDIEAMVDLVPWSKCTAGKAYVRDHSPANADLLIGLDLRPIELPKTGLNFRGRAMEILAVRVKRPESICELTGVA